MRVIKYWKADISGLIILLIIGFFVWMGNKGIDNNHFDKINYSSESTRKNSMLLKMEKDFESIDRILYATSDHLSIFTTDNEIVNYKYEHEAIWHNGEPLIREVKSFHFEYRDIYGNLLTHFTRNYTSIETIGFIVRKESKKQKTIYTSMVSVPKKMLSYSVNN
ncbi:MAG: hypothetical protein R6V04_16805 [bacterium]